jgi:hypothetical protein
MRFFSFLFIPIFLVSIVGCFGDGEVNIKTPPSFSEVKKVVITPFITEDESKETQELGKRLSVNLANRFELIFKDLGWVFDISEKVRPVGEKVEELGLTLNDVYTDPALAAKAGQALDADMIITGMVLTPKLRRKDSDEHLMRQGRQTGISGTSTYITTRQDAIGGVRVKVIHVASGKILYNNKISSFLKYWFAYQTQQSGQVVFKEEVEMLADLGKQLPLRISYMLYPSGLKRDPEEKVLLKPDLILKGTSGIFKFD